MSNNGGSRPTAAPANPAIRRLRSAQHALLLLLVVAVPLWVNLWGQQPFELPKSLLMRTVVWLLAGLFLVEIVLARRIHPPPAHHRPFLLPAALLAAVLALTTATAPDRQLSLWGSYARGQGALTLITYLLLLLLVSERLRTAAHARRLLAAMALASAPLVAVGMAQAMGWQPLDLVTDARSPIFATLGRSNFLGAYLALLVPLTLALRHTARLGAPRYGWALLLAGQLVVIGLTLARSAWLSAAVAAAVYALLMHGRRLSRVRRTVAWWGIGLVALSGPLLVLLGGTFRTGSVAARHAIWRATLELIARRPLLGYGADSLGIQFPALYPPELVYYQGRQFYVDRAHNLFLDWAAAAGLPGVLALLLLLGLFFHVSVRAISRPRSQRARALLAATVAAVAGNVVNNLLSFDVTPTATAMWLLIGVGGGLSVKPTAGESAPTPARSWRRWIPAGILLVIFGVAIWQWNGRPLAADIFARRAQVQAETGNTVAAISAARQAVALWPVEPAHHLLLARAYWEQAIARPDHAHPFLIRAESALVSAQALRPEDPNVWLHAADFYMSAERRFGAHTRASGHGAYRRAVALAPRQAALYAAWGREYLRESDVATAAGLLRRAVALDATHATAHLDLGAAELALGRPEAALGAYREAARLLPHAAEAHAGVADSFWRLGKPRPAAAAVAEALRRDPQNARGLALLRTMEQPP